MTLLLLSFLPSLQQVVYYKLWNYFELTIYFRILIFYCEPLWRKGGEDLQKKCNEWTSLTLLHMGGGGGAGAGVFKTRMAFAALLDPPVRAQENQYP